MGSEEKAVRTQSKRRFMLNWIIIFSLRNRLLVCVLALALEELVEALQANNQNVGGGQIVRSGESLLVHGVGLTTNVQEIALIVLT